MDDTAFPSPRLAPLYPSPERLAALARELAPLRHLPPEERLDALLAEQQRRWRSGERWSVEAYQQAFPELVGDHEAVLHLITSEAMLRRHQGEEVDLEEYLQRFPHYSDSLRRQFEVEAAFEQSTEGCVPTTEDSRITVDLPASFQPPVDVCRTGVPGFEILCELGRGGMGVVYKARQSGLNRVVALKMISAARNGSDQARDRFRREAAAVAQLSHPHIVPVYAFGEHAGQLFFAMGYVPGGSLAQKLQTNRPWPAHRAAELVATLAGAVQHAHDRGIIHRDLKPGNVLLDEEERPHVTDFGLARSLHADAVTVDGQVLGTPAYMAPEQAAGNTDRIGPASDVFGLGAILYQLLTGRPPFHAGDVRTTLHLAEQGQVVPVRSVQPDVPPRLARICEKALSADPRQRYPSAALLEKELRGYLQRKQRLFVSAAIALGLLAALVPVALLGSFLGNGRGGMTGGPEPLTGELFVRIWNRERSKLGLDILRDPGALPGRTNELVHLEARLNRPAYVYLLWIDEVEAVGLYPWEDRDLSQPPPLREPTQIVHSPPEVNQGWPLTGPSGLENVLLLARSTPLPQEVNLRDLVKTIPRVPLLEKREVMVRGFDPRGEIRPVDLFRGPRGVGKIKQQIDEPVFDLLDRLREHFEVRILVRFAKEEMLDLP